MCMDMSACWALPQPAPEESPGFCKEEGVFLTQPLFLAASEQEEHTWAQAKKPSRPPTLQSVPEARVQPEGAGS